MIKSKNTACKKVTKQLNDNEQFLNRILARFLTNQTPDSQQHSDYQDANCGFAFRHAGKGHFTTKCKKSSCQLPRSFAAEAAWKKSLGGRGRCPLARCRKADTVVFPKRNVSKICFQCSLGRNTTIRPGNYTMIQQSSLSSSGSKRSTSSDCNENGNRC